MTPAINTKFKLSLEWIIGFDWGKNDIDIALQTNEAAKVGVLNIFATFRIGFVHWSMFSFLYYFPILYVVVALSRNSLTFTIR